MYLIGFPWGGSLLVACSNYMMFEVLETSWGMLQDNLDSATTLDDLVEAHKTYMKGILARALLSDESTEVHSKVHEVGPCSLDAWYFPPVRFSFRVRPRISCGFSARSVFFPSPSQVSRVTPATTVAGDDTDGRA